MSRLYDFATKTSAQQKAKVASQYGSVMQAAQQGSSKAIVFNSRIETSQNSLEFQDCMQQCSKYGKHTEAYHQCVSKCKNY